MPNINEMIDSKYLKKEDVGDPGDGSLVTIQGVKQDNVAKEDEEPEMKWLIKFREFKKPMILNSTNIKLAAMIIGSNNTDDWKEKTIEVYHDPAVTFGDKLVGGIRFRKIGKTNTPVAASSKKHVDQFDDDIPF